MSVRRRPETTGVLDQNLDQVTPGTDLMAPPKGAKGPIKIWMPSRGDDYDTRAPCVARGWPPIKRASAVRQNDAVLFRSLDSPPSHGFWLATAVTLPWAPPVVPPGPRRLECYR